MNWENLRKNECPHCSAAIELDRKEHMIKCVQCRFKIEPDRFHSILRHRGQRPTSIIKMRWQNLQESRCPICANFLRDQPGTLTAVLRCSTSDCTFSIMESRLTEILRDLDHPANRFFNKINDDIDANLARLNNL